MDISTRRDDLRDTPLLLTVGPFLLLMSISSMSQWRGAMAYGYGNGVKEGRVDG